MSIRKVAVIGGGPAGLATVYELLHTTAEGKSTTGDAPAENPRFEVVGFEQREALGGTWAPSFDDRGIEIPPQDIMDTEKYHVVTTVEPSWEPPVDLKGSLVDKPVQAEYNKKARDLQWRQSGLYRDLYTNVPTRFTRFSYMEHEDKYLDKLRVIYPFLSQVELCNRIKNFVSDNNLNDYYRFNSRIESITKEGEKWKLVIRKSIDGDHDEWYEEIFDGVISAIGHYSIPNIPHYPGLAEFNRNFPGRVLHVKSFRNAKESENKRVLVIGASVSTINVLQYVVPFAKFVTVSSRGEHKQYEWINDAVRSKGIQHKPILETIDGKTGEVTFSDGTKEPAYDQIMFSTGYQRNLPFLKEYLTIDPAVQTSRVKGLYLNTFCIEDPSLASVGATTSPLTWFCMEASAAAIAGVWSKVKKLPPKEEQLKWESDREAEKGPKASFHFYEYRDAPSQIIEPLYKFFPPDRPNPIDDFKDHLDDIEAGIKTVERLFYKVKDGEIRVRDTVDPSLLD